MRKTIIFLFGVICITILSSSKPSEQIHLNANYQLLKSDSKSMSEKKYRIDIHLTNPTNKEIHFILMKCSWEDNFIFRKKDMYFLPKDCDGNYPKIYHLKAKHEIVLKSTICYIGKTNPCLTNNLGMIVVTKKELQENTDYYNYIKTKRRSKTDVIWCD